MRTNEEDTTVKEIVKRLETKSYNSTKPRIMETKCIEKQRKYHINNTNNDNIDYIEDRSSKKTRNMNLDLAYPVIRKKSEESDNMKNRESKCNIANNEMINIIELSSHDVVSSIEKTISNFNNVNNGECPIIECSKEMEFEEFEVLSDQPYDSLNEK